MGFKFTIIDYTNTTAGDIYVVNEPVGFDTVGMRLKREKTWHGFFDFFDDAINNMQWHDKAREVLKAAYDANGIEAQCELLLEYACSDTDEYETVYSGRFVFARYAYICGDMCYVECGVENNDCMMTFRNRYDQKVDLDSLNVFDHVCTDDNSLEVAGGFMASTKTITITSVTGFTPADLTGLKKGNQITITNTADNNGTYTIVSVTLGPSTTIVVDGTLVDELDGSFTIAGCLILFTLPAYDGLGKSVELPPVRILKKSEWRIQDAYTFGAIESVTEGNVLGLYHMPIGQMDVAELITSYQMQEWEEWQGSTFEFSNVPPILIAQEANIIYPITINYDIQISGTFTDNQTVVGQSRTNFELKLYLMYGNKDPNVNPSFTPIEIFDASGYTADPFSVDFDINETGSFSIGAGESVWLFWRLSYVDDNDFTVDIRWLYESSRITLTAVTEMEASKSDVYLINESLSRVTEAYTNDCMRVKSDFFGRTDSEPYASDSDGCGGLVSITNGLKIRTAKMQDDSEPKMLVSMKDLFEGLFSIYNIGMGVEPDTERNDGSDWIRVEPIKYFYNDTVLLTCQPSEVRRSINRDLIFSTVQVGYAKWETEEVLGLNDVFSKREFRTLIKQIKNEYNILCSFVGSSNAIEVTRRKFGLTTKDWRYDNNTFIICLDRIEAGFKAEQDNVESSSGITFPEDSYNLRISPIRNAIRHLITILSSYKNENNGEVLFAAGDGNIVASINLDDDSCIIENGEVSESQNLDIDISLDPDDIRPFLKAELVSFDYPITYTQYKVIKANPYGLIGFSCGNNPTEYGWIEDFQYKPYDGMGQFTLKLKR